MNFKLKKKIFLRDIIKHTKSNFSYFGNKKIFINNFSSINYSNLNSLSFIENEKYKSRKKIQGIVITERKNSLFKNQIIAKNPRLLFCKIVNFFLREELKKKNYPIENFKDLHKKKNSINTKISENVFIGEKVVIGKNCYIGKNVVIYPETKIGNNVIILDNTVLGTYGLGYTNGILMPHLGKLIIKDNVKLGANCTVVRGTLENTIIEKSVKIANNVNIGHNVKIQEETLIASMSVVSGGVKINKNCQLAAGVLIKNNIEIGKNSKIGIGSVVVKNVEKGSNIFGNPGKKMIFLKNIL